ncbi:MAG: RNA polymerase sigma factor [Ruminococcaceae bacterium]|nr:RNA polymerase sigma factor [Oscillospiraceae bacterium]
MADFEKIYRDHRVRIFAFLTKLCNDADLAEELTQETFYQAYRSLSRYDGRCAMFTWLAAIAKNVFFTYLRKSKAESMVIDLYVTDLAAALDDEPGYRLQRKLDIARVQKAIAGIPPKYSEVLILRIYGELPYEEIARKLGISVSSAKVIYFRAKNYVKEVLLND